MSHEVPAKVLLSKAEFRIVQLAKVSRLDTPQFTVERRGTVSALGDQNWEKSTGVEALAWLTTVLGDLLVENQRPASPT